MILLVITAGAGLLGVAGAFVAVPFVAIGVDLASYARSLHAPGTAEKPGKREGEAEIKEPDAEPRQG